MPGKIPINNQQPPLTNLSPKKIVTGLVLCFERTDQRNGAVIMKGFGKIKFNKEKMMDFAMLLLLLLAISLLVVVI